MTTGSNIDNWHMCSDQVTQDLELFMKIRHQWMCMIPTLLTAGNTDWLKLTCISAVQPFQYIKMMCLYMNIFFAVTSKYLAFLIADLNKDHLECEYWFDKVFFFLYLNKWCIFFNMLHTKYQRLCWLRPKIIPVSRSQTDLI